MVLRIAVFAGLLLVTAPALRADDPPATIRVATWNVEWFFDDFKPDNRSDLAKEQSAPSRDEYDWKKRKLADVIAALEPTVIALQEVEDRDIMFELTKELENVHKLRYRYALIDGFDFTTEQDVALLYRSGLVEYSRREQTAEEADSDQLDPLSKHLFGRFQWGQGADQVELLVCTCHFRAAPEQEPQRIRQARQLQAWAGPLAEAGANVILLGDFNSERDAESTDKATDLGVLQGLDSTPTTDDFTLLNRNLPAELRVTHLGGKQYDLILASPALTVDDPAKKDLVFSRIITRPDLVIAGERDDDHFNRFYEIPRDQRDVSDHYPVMAEFLVK